MVHSKLQYQLLHSLERDKISHALLFYGKSGYGTLPLALWYAAQLIGKNKNENSFRKVMDLQHADLHFCYPVTTTEKVKKNPCTASYSKEWREFYLSQPYANGFDWMQFIGAEKKQGIINVEQAKEILHSLNLRSYEGGYKVMIIWLPETMNNSTANKLLKIIEEPPQNTIFLLVTEDIDALLPTIISRCQTIQVPALQEEDLQSVLVENYNVESHLATESIRYAEGDVAMALEHLLFKSEDFETKFVEWVRNAFRAKKNAEVLQEIHDWAMELSGWSRERQKKFLEYCSETFRQALLKSYGADEISHRAIRAEDFKWDIFTKFIHGANIELIIDEINKASFHIERNGNAKIIFLDAGIKMTRFIHKKELIPNETK